MEYNSLKNVRGIEMNGFLPSVLVLTAKVKAEYCNIKHKLLFIAVVIGLERWARPSEGG